MIFSFYFLLIYRLVQLFITIWLLYKDFITINVILSIVNNKKGDRMHYYKRLRELREDHDLTQKDVANYLQMKQPQYFRYESGSRDIPSEVLISLAKLYKVSADYILELKDTTD